LCVAFFEGDRDNEVGERMLRMSKEVYEQFILDLFKERVYNVSTYAPTYMCLTMVLLTSVYCGH